LSTYHREYMFHNLLTDAGYRIVYRYRGVMVTDEILEQVFIVLWRKRFVRSNWWQKYLIDNLNIDSNRVGIYGGSYGGFITLMGMLTTQENLNLALLAFCYWLGAHNHGYTEIFLIQKQTLAYKVLDLFCR
jgi:hypothetical protein